MTKSALESRGKPKPSASPEHEIRKAFNEKKASNPISPLRPPTEIARYDLPYPGLSLVVARGSVVNFQGDAIVNAANEYCVGGGGVDGAISEAGGRNLARDRLMLPVLEKNSYGSKIRCKPGMAVLTGPNDYGRLPSYIIHAVGPMFAKYKNREDGVHLLKAAYSSALDIAADHDLARVGSSLLSAGVFRGPLSKTEVLSLAVEGISDWARGRYEVSTKQSPANVSVREVHLCAFTKQECDALKEVCDHTLPFQY